LNTKTIPAADTHAIPHALDTLRHGGIIAFPTDTVYGLAAIAFDTSAIGRLYRVKSRSQEKAIAILIAAPSQLSEVAASVPPAAQRLAEACWPGALTLILPRAPRLPDTLSAAPTIGVRIPDHPVALALLAAAGPLAVTSANLSGGANTSTAAEVRAQLGGKIHLILDGGRTPGGVPSTVVDCTSPTPKILREGPVTAHQIRKIVGDEHSSSS
jgi:L-threonylcarbamoyladenylate synthase